jgi:serine/threonine protein kinase
MVLVGSGKSGRVYKANYHGQIIAWKIFRSEAIDDDLIRDFCQEVQILSRLFHPNIVALRGYLLRPELAIGMDFCGGGTLQAGLAQFEKERNLSWSILVKLSLDIARAVSYLHTQHPPILHNDLKPDNMMLIDLRHDCEVAVKLVDFGFSIITSTATSMERDVKSFATVFKGIAQYYCNTSHPSATLMIDEQTKLLVPTEFYQILSLCEQPGTSITKIEFHLSGLLGTIIQAENSVDPSKSSYILLDSALKGSTSVLFKLIRSGVPYVDSSGVCFLDVAVTKWFAEGAKDIIRELLTLIDPNTPFGVDRNTLLMLAIKNQSICLIRHIFADPRLKINQTNAAGYSAVHVAASVGSLESLQLLKNASAKFSGASAILNPDDMLNLSLTPPTVGLTPLELILYEKYRLESAQPNWESQEISAYDDCIVFLLQTGNFLHSGSQFLPDRLGLMRTSIFDCFRQ